jgi:hypothetical protein
MAASLALARFIQEAAVEKKGEAWGEDFNVLMMYTNWRGMPPRRGFGRRSKVDGNTRQHLCRIPLPGTLYQHSNFENRFTGIQHHLFCPLSWNRVPWSLVNVGELSDWIFCT